MFDNSDCGIEPKFIILLLLTTLIGYIKIVVTTPEEVKYDKYKDYLR